MTLDAVSILGDSGRIADRLDNYEMRAEQLQMAEAVESAIRDEQHLLVEAGTGVGKSFAYLVPAILAAASRTSRDGNSKRIVISTNTISLQEQLISRDIPFLNAVLPIEFSAVLAKGRANYMSLRRMKGALERAGSMFSQNEQLVELRKLAAWSGETTDGSRTDLDFSPIASVWDEVHSDHGNCLGRQCPTYNDCFYYKARRRVWNADLIVVNHALFFSDLALRREGASVLPDYDVVVLDEAHTIENVAGNHLGMSVSSGQIDYHLNKLYNDRSNRGLLVHYKLNAAQQMTAELRFRQKDFFYALEEWQRNNGTNNGRIRSALPLENGVSPLLRELAAGIAVSANRLDKDEERIELTSASERCVSLADSIDVWMKQSIEDAVYWTELSGQRRSIMKLICAPIEVGPTLRDELFNQVGSVILTSATLAVGRQNFDFVKGRLGLSDTRELKLGSPFDYRSQVKLVLPESMPDPADAPKAFDDALCEGIKKYVAQTEGRAFVLFTSYKMMMNCSKRLTAWLAEENLALFCQGTGLPRSRMLERFRATSRSVLFGTDSFWQGVDVPGEALENVLIAKLPFSVPDHPLLEARMEAIRERGGNPFMEYQIPEAIIKLKQGFGRLIRSQSDTGQVVILDPRIRTKRYGKLFLDSLPDCQSVIDS